MKRKRKIINNVLSVVFFMTFVAMFILAGSMEQGTISDGQAFVAITVNFVVMGISGFSSEMLTIPTRK